MELSFPYPFSLSSCESDDTYSTKFLSKKFDFCLVRLNKPVPKLLLKEFLVDKILLLGLVIFGIAYPLIFDCECSAYHPGSAIAYLGLRL
jgi:hypothetical protein